jgi:hypothetical protein
MLDVHPPHQAAHTWKDFFIHIATIVIGLLIAVGLEQTVEYFHHRHQGHEAVRLLQEEWEFNRTSLAVNLQMLPWRERYLRKDLEVLERLRTRTLRADDQLNFYSNRYMFTDSNWREVQQNGTAAYLPKADGAWYVYQNEDQFNTLAHQSTLDLQRSYAVLNTSSGHAYSEQDLLKENVFIDQVAASHGHLDDATIQRAFDAQAIDADLARLSPADIDQLQHGVQHAISDTDAMLGLCYNIKRMYDDATKIHHWIDGQHKQAKA